MKSLFFVGRFFSQKDRVLYDAYDFRGRLRFPRAGVEPPRLRLRGLNSFAFPAGVFVFHSNQPLDSIQS
jgi:hypothetical protein